MKMELEFLNSFRDKYMLTEQGKGVFLTGVLLGYMARLQVQRVEDVGNAPLFKQMNFGRMTLRDLKKHIARMPELLKAYQMKYPAHLQKLANAAGDMLLKGEEKELGVDGNFTFTVGFTNAPFFFWEKIFPREQPAEDSEEAVSE